VVGGVLREMIGQGFHGALLVKAVTWQTASN